MERAAPVLSRGLATVACSRSASKAIFAFAAASIFRLVFVVIIRSVYHNRTILF
ncbi:MAG: hypothetical protein M0Z85_06165 [Gammaproteobacteria bacterium]|nr:hypothetical protein [Gammaproteobacteria bacterium]